MIKSIQFYLCSPKSQSHCLRWASSQEKTFAMLMRKKPFNRGENKDGRNLRKSSRGGIALPGQTDISAVFLFSRHCCQVPAHEGNVVSLQVKKKNKGVFSRPAQSVVRRPVLCIGAMQIKFD